MSSRPSSSTCTPWTPGASKPSARGRIGTLPVATTSWSYASSYSRPVSRSRAVTRRAAVSMPTTSVRMRTSMPLARCSSGVRAMSSCSLPTAPPIQYGMPHAEYDVARPRSNATTSRSSGPAALARLARRAHPRGVAADDHQPLA